MLLLIFYIPSNMIRLTRHDTRSKDYDSIFWEIGKQIMHHHIGGINYRTIALSGPLFPLSIKTDVRVQAITWQRDNRTIV